jgi:hypothetical protein
MGRLFKKQLNKNPFLPWKIKQDNAGWNVTDVVGEERKSRGV